MTFPVAMLRKSVIEKIIMARSRAAIVYNRHIGKMLLISDGTKAILPGYWWDLDPWRLDTLTPKMMADARSNPSDVDNSKPYHDEKYVICEIQMVDGRCKNRVDEDVWKRVREL